jgi:hypothetical protein
MKRASYLKLSADQPSTLPLLAISCAEVWSILLAVLSGAVISEDPYWKACGMPLFEPYYPTTIVLQCGSALPCCVIAAVCLRRERSHA